MAATVPGIRSPCISMLGAMLPNSMKEITATSEDNALVSVSDRSDHFKAEGSKEKQHGSQRHVRLNVHYPRDFIKNGFIQVSYVRSNDMVAEG